MIRGMSAYYEIYEMVNRQLVDLENEIEYERHVKKMTALRKEVSNRHKVPVKHRSRKKPFSDRNTRIRGRL